MCIFSTKLQIIMYLSKKNHGFLMDVSSVLTIFHLIIIYIRMLSALFLCTPYLPILTKVKNTALRRRLWSVFFRAEEKGFNFALRKW